MQPTSLDELARRVFSGSEKCCRDACKQHAVLIVVARGLGERGRFAIPCCELDVKYVVNEILEKQPGCKYTVHTTADGLLETEH